MDRENRIVVDYPVKPLKDRADGIIKQLPFLFKNNILSVFPIIQWIHRYNLSWLVQDMIAGITVGIVIVPQGMAYAKIAGLEPQYGLYTSFVAVTIYCIFGTSKDISMGPISTVSLLVSSAIDSVIKSNPTISHAEIAITLSLFTGIVMIVISLFRLGILINFIPEPVIAGYMTGSAITIVIGQWPKLLGISSVSTHESPYLVLVNTLANIQHTQLDVAFGISSLFILYIIRYVCGRMKPTSRGAQKCVFLFKIMRNGLVVVFGTLITFLIYRNQENIPISIIRSVPAGFDVMQTPTLRLEILSNASDLLPSIVLIMILEHVSVAKSFGRINGYQINPDQEILAIGVSNIIGSFLGGYPATGAFSRTAIMARSGVRTPLAGIFSGIVVVLALYVLTPAFYYIPDAVLSAVVIHAVSDLVSSGQYLKDLWSTSFIEFFVWASAIVATFFVDVEAGIYTAAAASLIIMLLTLARPPVKVLGRIPILTDHSCKQFADTEESEKHHIYVDENDINFEEHTDQLPSGIIALRLSSSILYPNAEYISDTIVDVITRKTQCSDTDDLHKNDRQWNHNAIEMEDAVKYKPVLKALLLDFSAVNKLDATAHQALITMRNTIDKYAGHPVEYHFVGLQHQSVRASLLTAGFGNLDQSDNCSLLSLSSAYEHIVPTDPYSYCSYGDSRNFIHELEADSITITGFNMLDAAHRCNHAHFRIPTDKYPCFHWDIDSAVRSIDRRTDKNKKNVLHEV